MIHPRAISTAQHCGPINQVTFTDAVGGSSPSVGVVGCVDTGSQDARICELAEPIENVPPAPRWWRCSCSSGENPKPARAAWLVSASLALLGFERRRRA